MTQTEFYIKKKTNKQKRYSMPFFHFIKSEDKYQTFKQFLHRNRMWSGAKTQPLLELALTALPFFFIWQQLKHTSTREATDETKQG